MLLPECAGDGLYCTVGETCVDGQCSGARMQADQDTLTALSQVTGWSARGDAVVLIGPRTFRFLVSRN